jgi:hypothetical protein
MARKFRIESQSLTGSRSRSPLRDCDSESTLSVSRTRGKRVSNKSVTLPVLRLYRYLSPRPDSRRDKDQVTVLHHQIPVPVPPLPRTGNKWQLIAQMFSEEHLCFRLCASLKLCISSSRPNSHIIQYSNGTSTSTLIHPPSHQRLPVLYREHTSKPPTGPQK